jgi:hypothetical protein
MIFPWLGKGTSWTYKGEYKEDQTEKTSGEHQIGNDWGGPIQSVGIHAVPETKKNCAQKKGRDSLPTD